MVIATEYVPPRSPARTLEEIDARLEALRGGVGDENAVQVARLLEERRRWAAEVEELRRELDEIARDREFAYALLRWLRDPSRPVGAIPGGVRER